MSGFGGETQRDEDWRACMADQERGYVICTMLWNAVRLQKSFWIRLVLISFN